MKRLLITGTLMLTLASATALAYTGNQAGQKSSKPAATRPAPTVAKTTAPTHTRRKHHHRKMSHKKAATMPTGKKS